MGQSVLGWKADKACVDLSGLSTEINKQLENDGLKKLLESIRATSDAVGDFDVKNLNGTISAINTTLQFAQNFAAFAGVAASVVAITKTLQGVDAQNQIKRLMGEMATSLKALSEATAVSTNLDHEQNFGKWVYDFVSYQISLYAGSDDLEATNWRSLTSDTGTTTTSTSSSPKQAENKPAHYFFVYHPASDWHPRFNAMVKAKPLPGFVGACNSLSALGLFLPNFRAAIGPSAVIHLLLPSAHMYVLAEEVVVPAEILPLKITGQRHYSNHPYCHATIAGLDECDVQEVGLLPKPNNVGAGTTAGAVGAGVGVGLAAGAVSAVTTAVVFGVLCPVSAPFFVAGLMATWIADVAVGTTAGTLTGRAIVDKARWGKKKNGRKDLK